MLPPGPQQYQQNVGSYKASGEMHVDVFGERAYFRGRESYKLGAMQDHAEGHDEYEFYFDGVTGRVALKFQGKFPAPLVGMPGERYSIQIVSSGSRAYHPVPSVGNDFQQFQGWQISIIPSAARLDVKLALCNIRFVLRARPTF